MEKLKIYQPKINSHVFSSNAHPEPDAPEPMEMKIWSDEISTFTD